MVSKKSTQEVRIVVPAHGKSSEGVDEVALYGFRTTHRSLWYLSPWEFVQWVKPHRLGPPSEDYKMTKWTPAGRKKQRESLGEKVAYKPYEDYSQRHRVGFFRISFSVPSWTASIRIRNS